jgi:hypothetical protein
MLPRKSQLIVCDREVGIANAIFGCGALLFVAASVSCLLGAPGPIGTAPMPFQAAQPAQVVAAPPALPEPIFWKQHLFLIPYQWGSAAEPGGARAGWLVV